MVYPAVMGAKESLESLDLRDHRVKMDSQVYREKKVLGQSTSYTGVKGLTICSILKNHHNLRVNVRDWYSITILD